MSLVSVVARVIPNHQVQVRFLGDMQNVYTIKGIK
jgi:hypothetical protein